MSCACVTCAGTAPVGLGVARASRIRGGRRASRRRGRRSAARWRAETPLAGDVDARRRAARAGRKFMPGEPMKWPTKVCCGRSNSSDGAADLHRPAARHHHHLLGEGQRLDLVVRDVDQRELELAGGSA